MNTMMTEAQSADVYLDDDESHLLEIIERGPDLSMRIESAKAAFDQFMADLDAHRFDSVAKKAQINEHELSGKIDSRTAVRMMRELAELVDRRTRETKERLKQRSAEIAQFDKEAAAIRWAEKQMKLRKKSGRFRFDAGERSFD
ncbi:MAG: hypothetical protein U0798_00265 [Gemmataceae bacterium]